MQLTYYICYDDGGFCQIAHPYCYAFSKKELKELVAYAIEEYGLDDEQICIFELTNMAVTTKTKSVKKIEDIMTVSIVKQNKRKSYA
jgi:hypothetical protein